MRSVCNKQLQQHVAFNIYCIVFFFFKCFVCIYADDLRRRVWPLLVGIDPKSVEPAPTLSELKSHPEYNQVILDVNRSLKRFPPGIPYDQRIALQDQLTVLILRVIIKYPHLKYYQVSPLDQSFFLFFILFFLLIQIGLPRCGSYISLSCW